MIRHIIILGTGGNSHDLLDIVYAANDLEPSWRIAGFLDDAKPEGTQHLECSVLGKLTDAPRYADCCFINAIGSPTSYLYRPEIIASTSLALNQFATLQHPTAAVSRSAKLGQGVSIHYGVSIGGNVKIGNHVSIGPGCIIGHDATIEDYTIVAPGAVISGAVHIGSNSYIGAGSSIREQLHIGNRSLVGMGAVVVRDVKEHATVVGNPAQTLRRPKPPLDIGNSFEDNGLGNRLQTEFTALGMRFAAGGKLNL